MQQFELFSEQDLSCLTPLMKQYAITKAEHKDTIVLFQVGDFYELFFDDAKKVSDFLGITLTKRGEFKGQPIPLCGFPIHAIDHYIPRLVKGGFKLALCDQLEAATAGKMVARGVTSVLTPGMLVSENLLDSKSNSYLFSFFPTKAGYGLLFSELLTSQLHATVLPHGSSRQLEAELFRFLPDEVLLLENRGMQPYESFFKQRGFFTTSYGLNFDQALIQEETAWLANQLDPKSFGALKEQNSLLYATILWKKYVQKNQQKALCEFRSITMYEPESFLMLDGATQKNLDIVKNSFDGSRSHSLFSLMDKAITPMGSRMIKRWLLSPLMDKKVICERQNVVQEFLEQTVFFQKVQNILAGCGDMQRIVGRIALDRATVHDYANLGEILSKLPTLKQLLQGSSTEFLQGLAQSVDPLSTGRSFSELQSLLKASCNNDADIEGIIKKGFHEPLDRMRDLVENGTSKILELERQEVERTGISSLKIRHNNLQGYYIEITKTNLDSVPEGYIEQQSLVGRKRFTIKALQALQFEILSAQQQFSGLEKEVFGQVKAQVKIYVHDLRLASQVLASIDALVGFARVSYEFGWVRPEFHDGRDILIKGGKHPIVAASLSEKFIANDTNLTDIESLWIVTGPNMGGKSTYLRQVALICLLAQCGSNVPAQGAQLAILDRIFTRIGAGDFLAQGKSTFLIEMEETAQILQSATEHSLVILDEVGRGTSTYDGLALAQAIVEYIFTRIKARCLFATHYHELTDLQEQMPGIVSYYADSVRSAAGILFLHKIVAGKADGSFGLEVAKLAHVPQEVIFRAQQVLRGLHENGSNLTQGASCSADSCGNRDSAPGVDLAAKSVAGRVSKIDFDNVSPKQALDILWELKQLLS